MDPKVTEAVEKAEAAGRTFKAKAIAFVTNKFWIAVGFVVVAVVVVFIVL
jgi:hypothetical protein